MVGDTLSCNNAAQHSSVCQSFIGETSKITRRVLWEFITCSGPPSHLKGTIELTPVLPTCLYIPNSIKAALGRWAIGHWEAIVCGHSRKALHCVPYAQMPNVQLPMTNCQSNLYGIRYINYSNIS